MTRTDVLQFSMNSSNFVYFFVLQSWKESDLNRWGFKMIFLKLKLTGTSRFKFLSVLRQSERDSFGFVAIETVWRRNWRDRAQVRFFIGICAGVEGTTPSVYGHDVANHLTHGILENTYKIEATIWKEYRDQVKRIRRIQNKTQKKSMLLKVNNLDFIGPIILFLFEFKWHVDF